MIKRLVTVGIAALTVSLVLALSACRNVVQPPAEYHVAEVIYKGHTYVISRTYNGYSVMAHAGHCEAEHK